MLIVPALTIMSDDSAGGGVLLDSSDAASTSAYDPPEETLRIVVDNGGNTTNIDMRKEDDDEEEEDNSDIKVYRALINDDSCEDSLDRLKLFQSLGSPADSAQFLQQLMQGEGFDLRVRVEDGAEKTLTFEASP